MQNPLSRNQLNGSLYGTNPPTMKERPTVAHNTQETQTTTGPTADNLPKSSNATTNGQVISQVIVPTTQLPNRNRNILEEMKRQIAERFVRKYAISSNNRTEQKAAYVPGK